MTFARGRGMNMTRCTTILAALVLTGCAMGDTDGDEAQADVGTAPAFGIRCPGCGGNGLAKRPYDYIFGQLNRRAMQTAGLYAATNEPKSLCSSTSAGACTCRPEWA